MELRNITRKLRFLLNILAYASIAYGAYLAYLQYQEGGLDYLVSYFMALPVEVLGILVIVGALVLTAALGSGE